MFNGVVVFVPFDAGLTGLVLFSGVVLFVPFKAGALLFVPFNGVVVFVLFNGVLFVPFNVGEVLFVPFIGTTLFEPFTGVLLIEFVGGLIVLPFEPLSGDVVLLFVEFNGGGVLLTLPEFVPGTVSFIVIFFSITNTGVALLSAAHNPIHIVAAHKDDNTFFIVNILANKSNKYACYYNLPSICFRCLYLTECCFVIFKTHHSISLLTMFSKQNIYSKLLIMCLLVITACTSSKHENPHIEIETNFGDIEVELYAKQAPITVAAFLSYINSGYFTKATFYRVLRDDEQPSNAPKAELIQGGIWQTNYRLAATIPGIKHETTQQTKILHKDGAISLARSAPGTANTEFFICVGDQPGFDYGGANNPDGQGYAAFGRVVKGMAVVRNIYNAPETDGTFDPLIYIHKIKKL